MYTTLDPVSMLHVAHDVQRHREATACRKSLGRAVLRARRSSRRAG